MWPSGRGCLGLGPWRLCCDSCQSDVQGLVKNGQFQAWPPLQDRGFCVIRQLQACWPFLGEVALSAEGHSLAVTMPRSWGLRSQYQGSECSSQPLLQRISQTLSVGLVSRVAVIAEIWYWARMHGLYPQGSGWRLVLYSYLCYFTRVAITKFYRLSSWGTRSRYAGLVSSEVLLSDLETATFSLCLHILPLCLYLIWTPVGLSASYVLILTCSPLMWYQIQLYSEVLGRGS